MASLSRHHDNLQNSKSQQVHSAQAFHPYQGGAQLLWLIAVEVEVMLTGAGTRYTIDVITYMHAPIHSQNLTTILRPLCHLLIYHTSIQECTDIIKVFS